MKYNVIDLFCGCGGFSLGFFKSDYNIALATDFDRIALESYNANNKNIDTLYADITKINYEKDIKPILKGQEVDVIIGGPPCKGMKLSMFGNLDTTENRLFMEYIRLVEEIKPKAFIIENISDFTYNEDGKIKDSVLKYFYNIGYSAKNFILCSEKYGVPQKRERSITIGIKGKVNEITFPESHNNIITCEEALSDLPALLDVYESTYYDCEPKNEYQKLMRINSNKVSNHYVPLDLQATTEYLTNKEYRKFIENEVAENIDTRPKHRNQLHYKHDRLLTVRECARLQSFPDDFIFLGEENQQYMQVGNAIPPLLAQYIAERLKNYLNEKYQEGK